MKFPFNGHITNDMNITKNAYLFNNKKEKNYGWYRSYNYKISKWQGN